MARVHSWLAVSLLSFAAVGCVSQEKYAAARMDAEQYAARLGVVEREKAEAIAGRDLLQRQLDMIGLGTGQKDALVINQANQINELNKQLADMNRRYTDAMGAMGRAGQNVFLPQPLNDALQQFALQNPDLVDYDQSRGIVKFKSDVTFTPGSAVLTSQASSAIDRFATILNSPAAAGYELMVVGHTDNVHVAHQATINAGHKDNWYLSCHRAISVSSELQKQAVSSSRLEVAGCADQRPIAPNTSEGGKAQNRRVEVLILPTAVRNSLAAAPAPVARPASARISKPTAAMNKDFNKDVPETDTKKTAFNK
jgi:chemotaxis protein MotB